jgi:hypothetical protein
MKNVLKQQKYLGLAVLLSCGQIVVGTQAVYAQGTMSDKAMEKSHFYTAPREYQIIDDRPVVRDFREAPQTGGQIGIPDGPGGGQGAGGMGGIGGGSGANPIIPSNGLPLTGGTGPAYKNAPIGMNSLPKSGFGATGSNIPAHGMGPRGILPGVSMGVVGKVMSQNKPVAAHAAPLHGVSIKGPSVGGGKATPAAPTAVTSYGGYGSHPTSYGNSSRTEQNVRGHLLRSK